MRFLVWLLPLLWITSCAAQQKLDLSKPADVLLAQRKIQSSLKEGENCFYAWEGTVYSRVPGERDKLLFTYVAMNVRATATVKDSVKGIGYQQVSREVLLFLDPKTKQILKTWKSPWTNKEVEVVHIANDPVNMRPAFAPKEVDNALRNLAGTIFWDVQIPLFYPNPLGGDYQTYVGGTYQAMEMFNFSVPETELIAAKERADDVIISWTRVCKWMPWMEMGDLAGQLIFNGSGKKVKTFEAIPTLLRDYIQTELPAFKTAPPLDDKRPNETSWTYFKKWLDAKKLKK
ncbi:MAG: hypothetical protein RLZZ628_4124 [Bacteroidota bacterium]|jgi:hypothetical protein